MSEMNNEVVEMVERISPILAGREPAVQSAVIAELLSRWVLGFQIPSDRNATRKVQDQFLARHIQLVRDLIAVQSESAYKQIMERN